MKHSTTIFTAVLAAAFLLGSTPHAATPPGLVNYQGVLRDAADKPLDGDHDMVFRFFTAETGGDEILIDRHTAADSEAVTVAGGLFSVWLGAGAVQDGSSLGAYTSLAEVFGEYPEVWLRVEIGGEVLDPRVRIVAAAYAINADRLDGRDGSGFIDTTSTPQAKNGRLSIYGTASGGYGLVVQAQGGAYLEDTDDSGQAWIAYADTGIWGYGNSSGGYFQDVDSSGQAEVASGDYGIRAYGDIAAGTFENSYGGSYMHAGREDYGLRAYGNLAGGTFDDLDGSGYAYVGYGDSGIHATGNSYGGLFQDSNSSGFAFVGYGDYGIEAYGNIAGGTFENIIGGSLMHAGRENYGLRAYGNLAGGTFDDLDGSGYAYVGYGDRGIEASGTEMGGYFADSDSTGYARVGWSDYGIYAEGNFAGGEFHDRNETGWAILGHQDYGIWAAGSGIYGKGGFFEDQEHGTWATVADQNLKIQGSGSVSFVQNHPELTDRVIVYTAPEGDEVATYTRGTARLTAGEAKVSLGETFKWVTNPDIGLTVHLTPRGEPIALSVASISTEELVVLGPADSDAVFDYMVFGLRIGFEETGVVQEKTIESFIPSMSHNRVRYEEYPELRRFNALERFKVMTTEVENIDAVDLSRAAELKAAIQEYDPEVHGPAEQLLGHGRPRPDQEIAEGAVSEAYDDGASPAEHAQPAIAGLMMTGATDGRVPQDRLPAVELRGDPLPASAPVEAGQVLAFDPEHPGKVRAAATMADPAVIGVAFGMTTDDGLEARVVLTGSVECEVDAGYGAIRAGDILTSSPTPGHAMRAIEALPGTILGKALEPLESGTGTIRILVMPR